MRSIVPSELYTSEAKKFAEKRELDDAFVALFWALQNNAEDFPVIPGYKTLRMAKTDAVRNIPALHLIFKILGDAVRLEYIETAETDGFRGPPLM